MRDDRDYSFLPEEQREWMRKEREKIDRMERPEIRAVGYWRYIWPLHPSQEDNTAHLPDPRELIRPEPWPDDVKEALVEYLNSKTHDWVGYRGSSRCRICGEYGHGSHDVSDGVYKWPSGLSHYVAEHDVDLPVGFVQHILG